MNFSKVNWKKNEYFYRVVKPPEVRMPFQIHRFHYLLSSQRTCSQSRKHIQWELPYTSHLDPSGIFIRNLKSGPLILICHVRNAEVVHVCECFLEKSSPLLRNPADLVLAVRSHHLELHLTGAGHGAPGAQHYQRHVACRVSNLKPEGRAFSLSRQSLFFDFLTKIP